MPGIFIARKGLHEPQRRQFLTQLAPAVTRRPLAGAECGLDSRRQPGVWCINDQGDAAQRDRSPIGEHDGACASSLIPVDIAYLECLFSNPIIDKQANQDGQSLAPIDACQPLQHRRKSYRPVHCAGPLDL